MLRSDYDRLSDVLYIYIDRPVPALTEPEEDGLLLRRSLETDDVVGLTVIGYNREWAPYRERLLKRIASLLHVDTREAREALRVL